MKFKVTKAEAIYTGGGIYVYCGMIEGGQHFLASDDDMWVLLTNDLTMTDELDDDEWNDRWYSEWMEEHATYCTESESEADEWMMQIYQYIINRQPDGNYLVSDIKNRRDALKDEMNARR